MRTLPRWPLFLIALPAAVAVWSGWVSLGQLCGFGLVEPLPGITAWHLNTAMTLPVGLEAYGAYALGAWLTSGTPEAARKFARSSAIGALALGMTGQAAYHLLAAAHATRAPWPVVVLVSCLPVVVLGFGAALAHLLRGEAELQAEAVATADESLVLAPVAPVETTVQAPMVAPDATVTEPETAVPERTVQARPGKAARRTAKSASRAASKTTPETHFADALAASELPSVRRIQREMHLGQPKARQVQRQLAASMNGHNSGGDQ